MGSGMGSSHGEVDEGKDDNIAAAQGKKVGDNRRGDGKAGYDMYMCTYQRKTYLITVPE